jgi:hypothetical protein
MRVAGAWWKCHGRIAITSARLPAASTLVNPVGILVG